MAINTEKCCNFCKNSTIISVGSDEKSRYNLYCNFDDNTRMVDLSVPRDRYVEKPCWCPLMKNSSNKEITKKYQNALNYFQNHKDNAAQIEVNYILNSNASVSIKNKASMLMTYFEIPDFDSISDVPSFSK